MYHYISHDSSWIGKTLTVVGQTCAIKGRGVQYIEKGMTNAQSGSSPYRPYRHLYEVPMYEGGGGSGLGRGQGPPIYQPPPPPVETLVLI